MAQPQSRKSSKVTLADVARTARVGTATVDRVLNERENVSEQVRKRVLAVARELGLRRILPETHYRMVRIEVILPRPDLPLIERMNIEFQHLARRLDHSVSIHRTILKDETPEMLASALRKTKCEGVVVYAPDHPLVNDAIAELVVRNVCVVTLISDLPSSCRKAYAGIDHYKAGRTAGAFMSRIVRRPGAIAILCNKFDLQSHAERIHGFSDYLFERAPDLEITDIVEGGDDRAKSEILLKSVFKIRSNVVGVYNAGAANLGVAAAIRADILESRPIFIGHELTKYSAPLLREGIMTLAIDQAPELQSQFAIEVLLNEFGFAKMRELTQPYKSPVPIVLYSAENIPDYAFAASL